VLDELQKFHGHKLASFVLSVDAFSQEIIQSMINSPAAIGWFPEVASVKPQGRSTITFGSERIGARIHCAAENPHWAIIKRTISSLQSMQ
jgi:hypothetical protein